MVNDITPLGDIHRPVTIKPVKMGEDRRRPPARSLQKEKERLSDDNPEQGAKPQKGRYINERV